MMTGARGILFCLLIGLLVASASAQVIYHNDSVRTNYGAGDVISGILNVTLNQTNLDAPVRTNFGNTSVSLRSLLAANGFVVTSDYNCSTSNCLPGYARKASVSSITLSNNQALVGFSLQGGSINGVETVQVTFDSTASPSCYLDLSLDILNQSSHYVTSNNYRMESCFEARYGCFESGRSDHDSVIISPGTSYCEKITLPVAPAFLVGAHLSPRTTGLEGVKMRLHALDSTPLGECALPSVTSANQVVECVIPYASAVQREYFVCVEPTGAGSDYRIRVETNAPCGTNTFGSSYPGDYEIFAKNLQFDTPRIDLSESAFYNATTLSLASYVSQYVSEIYGGTCNPYCILPLRIFGTDQTVSVSNAFIRYTSSLGQHTSSTLYAIERENVSITSRVLPLDLGRVNLTIPSDARGNRLRIYIDNQEVVSKSINLSSSFAFTLTPLFATFGQATTFSITSPSNITSVRWTFGDGSAAQTSSGKSISYRYLAQGTFNLEVEATRSDGVVSRRTFSIAVGNARDAATALLDSSQRRLDSASARINAYPVWIREDLKTQLGYDMMNQSLREARLAYARATNDSEYARIVTDLIAAGIPENVQSEVKGTVPLILGLEHANVDAVRELSGEPDAGTDEDLRLALASWMLAHTNADVSFEVISALREGVNEPLLTLFTIQTRPVESFEEVHLVLGFDSNDIHFSSPRELSSVAGSTALALGSANEVIEFSILDSLRPEELGAYITPALSSLGTFEEQTYACNFNAACESGESWKSCPNDCRPWGLAVVLIISLIVGGAIVLGLILWWYKRMYESSLFPNRQDFANLLTFITVSITSGMDPTEIRKKLKHAGWTGEQIVYAMKKQKTLKVRPGESVSDVRFIKRPDFKAP